MLRLLRREAREAPPPPPPFCLACGLVPCSSALLPCCCLLCPSCAGGSSCAACGAGVEGRRPAAILRGGSVQPVRRLLARSPHLRFACYPCGHLHDSALLLDGLRRLRDAEPVRCPTCTCRLWGLYPRPDPLLAVASFPRYREVLGQPEEACPVCMDEWPTVMLGCTHCFCATCLSRLRGGGCPICRLDIARATPVPPRLIVRTAAV